VPFTKRRMSKEKSISKLCMSMSFNSLSLNICLISRERRPLLIEERKSSAKESRRREMTLPIEPIQIMKRLRPVSNASRFVILLKRSMDLSQPLLKR